MGMLKYVNKSCQQYFYSCLAEGAHNQSYNDVSRKLEELHRKMFKRPSSNGQSLLIEI